MLLFLLLLSIPKEIFGIDCVYSDESFELELDDFNYDKFKTEINNFSSYDYTDDNIDMCRVEIYIDYKSRKLIISFADSFNWSPLDDGEALLNFLIVFNENNTEPDFYNVLEYACYDQNQCNKLFVFNHIHWLKQVNYTKLQTQLKSLLFNNSNQTENCFTGNFNPVKCSSGVCLGKYFNYHNNYLFECHKNAETLVEVHITTSMIIEENRPNEINVLQQQIIRYTCKFNQCNNQLLTDSLINIVGNEFQLTEMKDALIALYQQIDLSDLNVTNEIPFQSSKQEFSSSSTTTTTTTTVSEDVIFNTANKSFYISINLFLILLFYFI